MTRSNERAPRGSRAVRAGAAAVAAAVLGVGAAAGPAGAAGLPREAFTISDPRITESSGLAASRAHPGVYWTHNDSDDGPYVYAVDSQGRTVATVILRGIKPRDVEAISLGPDGRLYLGDIGDNRDGTWPEVWIYRFDEPKELRDQTVDAVRYRVRYEDGPRDAEALMVHPVTGRAYIASKRQSGGRLYQGPETLSDSGVNLFHPIADVPWTTDGAFSPDGTRLVLRGYFSATAYRWQDGHPVEDGSVNVPFQRQGESVTYSADGTALLFGSEGKDSTVWRETLDAKPAPTAGAGSGAPTGAASPGATATGSGAGGGSGSGGGVGGGAGGSAVLAVLVVGAVVLAVRRRRDS
ncbi:WD40 repeat domain-containing protein [Kitasatospora sp. NPDC048540]|uniref:WD40 repeat domain-containing protein n=1 Tax=Kitasatospora sp. NPDC048540 TaxID=3155634 RepID=UPI00340D3828